MNGLDDVDTVFLLGLTRDIVVAYAAHNPLDKRELTVMIQDVYTSLLNAPKGEGAEIMSAELTPAIAIQDSVTDDYITCLEDGLPFKSLKRHLRSKYGLSPEAYREKWQLPDDYPMVAPNYAKARSRIAKSTGLGRK